MGARDKSYDGEISVIKVPGTAGVRYHYLEARLTRQTIDDDGNDKVTLTFFKNLKTLYNEGILMKNFY